MERTCYEKNNAQRKFHNFTRILKTWDIYIKWDVFVYSHPSVVRNPTAEEAERVSKTELIRDTMRTRPSKLAWKTNLKSTHRDWNTKHRTFMALHYSFAFNIVMGFLSVWMSLNLVPSLALFSVCLFALLNFGVMIVWNILFCYF